MYCISIFNGIKLHLKSSPFEKDIFNFLILKVHFTLIKHYSYNTDAATPCLNIIVSNKLILSDIKKYFHTFDRCR